MTNSEEEKYEQIERYINRQLSTQEQEAFEAEISRDPDLKREVEAYREAQLIMVDQGVLDVKMQLQNIHRNELRRMRGRKYYLGGAVLVIVSATLSYLYFTKPAATTQEKQTNAVADTTIITTKENTGVISSIPSTNKDVATIPNTGNNTSSSAPLTNTNTPAADTTANTLPTPVDGKEKKDNTNNSNPISPTPATNPAPQTVDCATVTITGDAQSMATCQNDASGKIVVTVNSLRGGTRPYKFALDKEDEFRTSSQFTELEVGTYHLYVKDKNNCVSEIKQVEVTTKLCSLPAGFTPDNGETWKIEGLSGQLKIMDRANQIVFSATLHSNTIFEWNGTDQNGMSLPTAAYHYMIITDSGNVINGSVTILR